MPNNTKGITQNEVLLHLNKEVGIPNCAKGITHKDVSPPTVLRGVIGIKPTSFEEVECQRMPLA